MDAGHRRSPESYLPCEAEKATVGFHPLRLTHGQMDGGKTGDPLCTSVIHAGVHGVATVSVKICIKMKITEYRRRRLLPRRGKSEGKRLRPPAGKVYTENKRTVCGIIQKAIFDPSFKKIPS